MPDRPGDETRLRASLVSQTAAKFWTGDKVDRLLHLIALLAAGVLLYQVAHLLFVPGPLKNVRFPDLPTLSNPSSGQPSPSPGTDRGSSAAKAASNAVAASVGRTPTATNANLTVSTNQPPPIARGTGSNSVMAGIIKGTNTPRVAPVDKTGGAETNRPAGPRTGLLAGAPARPGMMMAGGGPPGMVKPVELPPEAKARVDRIVDSELLGPAVRPLPTALLGIAGNDAFLRSSTGQSGLVQEGGTLGSIKLIRIGINRVLVEEDGQPKELMIFSGLGGESLMPTNKTNLP
jgi:hypothetical protein